MSLVNKTCVPCKGGVPPLNNEQKEQFMKELDREWILTGDKTKLLRKFKFKDFAQAMDVAQQIGKVAEQQWHHPELHIGYGHLEVEIWTHKISDLVESDFILGAKIDKLYNEWVNDH